MPRSCSFVECVPAGNVGAAEPGLTGTEPANAGAAEPALTARGQAFFLPMTTLARAHRMPTVNRAVPNTKTCGGMPIRVAP